MSVYQKIDVLTGLIMLKDLAEEHRTMYAKIGIKRYLSKRPDKRVLQNTNPNIVRVFDMESKSYKSFKLSSVFEFCSGNIILK